MKPQSPLKMPAWEKVSSHDTGRGVFVQTGLDLSTHVYRYMAAERALQALRDRTLYLSSVGRWADPYERWWCEQLFREGSKLATVRAFGCCWTTRCRSEPFWRLYEDRCSQTDGDSDRSALASPPIRIKARLSNLVAELSSAVDETEAKVFVGRVYYCLTDSIKARAAKLRVSSKEVASDAATALHMKRYGFWFEKEIRVLWIDKNGHRAGHKLSFDIKKLIEGVMIGPSTRVALCKELKQKVVSLGVPAEKVKRSLIYKAPAGVSDSEN